MPVARVRCLFPPKCRCSTPDADHYGLCSNFYMARGHSGSSSRTTGNVRAKVIDHDGAWHGTLSAGFNSNIKLQRTKLAKSALPVPHTAVDLSARVQVSTHGCFTHTLNSIRSIVPSRERVGACTWTCSCVASAHLPAAARSGKATLPHCTARAAACSGAEAGPAPHRVPRAVSAEAGLRAIPPQLAP